MRRVASVYLPNWPTDRLRRTAGDAVPPDDAPLVVAGRVGNRRVDRHRDDHRTTVSVGYLHLEGIRRRTTGRGAKDRLEQEGDAFRVALREQFLTLAESEPERFVVVDADRPVDQVADDVIEAVVAAVRRHGVHLAHGGAHQGVLLGLEAFVEAAARRSAADWPRTWASMA